MLNLGIKSYRYTIIIHYNILYDQNNYNKYNINKYISNSFCNVHALFSDACGGIIEATNGTITSPSFPDLYPGNKSCIWEIIAPIQFKITLNFTHFDLEGNNVSQTALELIVISYSTYITYLSRFFFHFSVTPGEL